MHTHPPIRLDEVLGVFSQGYRKWLEIWQPHQQEQVEYISVQLLPAVELLKGVHSQGLEIASQKVRSGRTWKTPCLLCHSLPHWWFQTKHPTNYLHTYIQGVFTNGFPGSWIKFSLSEATGSSREKPETNTMLRWPWPSLGPQLPQLGKPVPLHTQTSKEHF